MNEKGFLIDVRTSGEEEVFMRKMMMNKFTETDLWEVLSTMMLQVHNLSDPTKIHIFLYYPKYSFP